MDYKIKRLKREKVYGGSALEFMQDLMELPDGKRETWDFVHHRRGGGACVVPVLDDGRISGVGTHDELVASNDIYRGIYELQSQGGGDFDEAAMAADTVKTPAATDAATDATATDGKEDR